MVGAVHQLAPILSVASFRAWLTSRPDEEHWELIEGVPMMMTTRAADGWHSRVLQGFDELCLPEFGRVCPVSDVYRSTPPA